ncbi:MAG: sugar phosphate isomerase/epimerase [Verrucomicrobiota bacterium]|nr:sugar phosphate isomerase/epimerase [Verrucomicrobiota bacterium]
MNAPRPLTRRRALKSLAAVGALSLTGFARGQQSASIEPRRGRIKQSVVPWCFKPMPVEELAKHAAELRMASVELCDPKSWPQLKELGLTCAIAGSHGFAKGFAHKEEWDECLGILRKRIEECAAAGVGRVITFSGFRRGLSDEEGIANMVAGLEKIVGFAEEKKVTLCVEMLNSRVAIEMKGHPDYFCDDIERTVEICRRVGSERMKVLFDIYHVQIMHGDVITRIKQHAPYIAHIHTAGVPGRAEIDDTQELNYPPLMKALLEIGYTGFVGQEFIPVRDKVQSLAQAVRICDV